MMKPEIERVVILGHTGFIGGALLRYFQQKGAHEVYGFSASSGDVRIPESLGTLEKIVDRKTALIVTSAVTRERGDTFEVFNTNVSMIANVVQVLESHPAGCCVYYSSIAVYGDPETNLAMNEETPAKPDSYYALAKYAGEFILEEAAKRNGFPLLVLRASRVYGPGDTHATYGPMKFIRNLLEEGKVYLFGEGEELRDHLYIDDLVQLTDRLIHGNFTGRFNLVTGKSRNFREIVEIFRKLSPQPFETVHVERKKPLIHQEFDIRKLSRAVPGFVFTDIQKGLQETFHAFAVLGKNAVL